ncbi:MAG: DUF4329 domain-containing protein, partial [Pseudomonadales bacterium]
MGFYTHFTGLTITILAALLSACSSIPTADDGVATAHHGAQLYDNSDMRAQVTALTRATFSSPLAAVMAAENEYNPLSIAQDREFIGAILQHNGLFRYTVGQGLSGEDTVTVRVAVPRGAEIVAFWHTHGAAGHGRRYFSREDTALVNSWNKPFYMADYSGTLRVFNPGDPTMTATKAR